MLRVKQLILLSFSVVPNTLYDKQVHTEAFHASARAVIDRPQCVEMCHYVHSDMYA